MGIPILALFLVIAAQSVSPAAWRNQLRECIKRNAAAFGILYIGFAGAFVAFGTVRALFCFLGR